MKDFLILQAIRFLNWQRLRHERRGGPEAQQERLLTLLDRLSQGPLALQVEEANRQHYELPASFFQLVLGPHRKYSSAYWTSSCQDLGEAERAMLELYCERAELRDGQTILELGCGWGSLTELMARSYPASRILLSGDVGSSLVPSGAPYEPVENFGPHSKSMLGFHRRYMVMPIEINPSGRKVMATVQDDEGVFPSTPAGLARLKPVLPGGSVTYGGQTYPADGNAGMILAGRQQARELSREPGIEIRLIAFAEGRERKGFMPAANVPAIRRVLDRAGITLADVKAIKTHNPFAVNDCYLSRELGIPATGMNNFGCSLIWGHPQAPTGMRLLIELIEELALLGGGYGLFSGCAAGDTAAAIVIHVDG